jgi:hypothetical protein
MKIRYASGGVTTHGYGAYSNGCRCEICREAKAAYMRKLRDRRHRLRRYVQGLPDAGRYVVDGITHGYAGYQEFSCRCRICRAATAERHRRARAAR